MRAEVESPCLVEVRGPALAWTRSRRSCSGRSGHHARVILLATSAGRTW